MPVILYQNSEETNAFQHFLDTLRSSQLLYLASDLLDNGLSPKDLTEAIQRAMTVCKTGGKNIKDHFLPIYSSYRGKLVNDCKLSSLGYALVLLNARGDNRSVAEWQLELLERTFVV